ncbi:MAG TPA: bifunctional hydroxymethylpyrimidine kinase/phosphomethylpyrimidine kinase [Thermoanaerobaculia bacterium]
MPVRPSVLTIAGSDSGGGAGIQADLKTIAAFGLHGASAIAAITAQNSREVTDVLVLADSIIEAQIDAVMKDLAPTVVKIGMLGNARVVELVARKLEQWRPSQIVLDPVMIASSGAALLEEDAIDALRTRLLPLATIITPNWSEAGALINAFPRGLEDVERIVISLQRLGAKAMLIKGGHLAGGEIVDTLFDGEEYVEFKHPRLRDAEGHGTGCALASAVAAGLARGWTLRSACQKAVNFVHAALASRYATGGSKENYLDLGGSET